MIEVGEDDMVYHITIWKKPLFDGICEGDIDEQKTFLEREEALIFLQEQLKEDTRIEVAFVPAYKVAEFAEIKVVYNDS